MMVDLRLKSSRRAARETLMVGNSSALGLAPVWWIG